jgi:hypothetical protein
MNALTPLGFIRGTITVNGLPKEPTGLQIQIIAKSESGQATGTAVPPNIGGSGYALPLSPGKYFVSAIFGTTQSEQKQATVTNGQATEINFAFG